MAKKKPAKKAAKKPAARVPNENDDDPNFEPGPPPKVVDVVALNEEIQERFDRLAGYDSAYDKQKDLVESLAEQLAHEKQVLERMAAPIRAIESLINSGNFKRLTNKGPYDDALRKCIGRVTTSENKYKGGKWQPVPTGAKKWSDLQKSGCTDQQILKNLQNIEGYGVDGYRVDTGSYGDKDKTLALRRSRNSPHHDHVPVLKGKDLIAAVRRVMAIGEPTKAAAAHKPAAKKKPAAKASRSTPAKAAKKSNKKPAGKTSSKAAPRSTPAKKPKPIEQPTAKTAPKKNGTAKRRKKTEAKRSREEVSAGVVEQLGLKSGNEKSCEEQCLSVLRSSGKPISAGDVQAEIKGFGDDVPIHEIWLALEALFDSGKANLKDGKYSLADVAKPDPKSTLTVSTEGVTIESILAEGPASSKTVGLKMGLTTDAAGAQLRRRIKAGTVRRDGELYELVAKPASEPAAAVPPEDVALNTDFEQALRDRGKKRNDVRKQFNGEDPIDEDLAGEKALKEEREFTEKYGDTGSTVVVDRTRSKAAKGTVRNPRATPFGGKPK